MKSFLFSLLTLFVLGLCGVCALQWQREHVLNERVDALVDELIAENQKRLELEEKAGRFEKEIERLTTLRSETEASLLEAMAKLDELTVDQGARGYSIGFWMKTAQQAQAESSTSAQLAGKTSEAIKDRNTEVGAQNEAIEKANVALRKLASERDDLIAQLNARTQEFNALVEKYNKLSKQR